MTAEPQDFEGATVDILRELLGFHNAVVWIVRS